MDIQLQELMKAISRGHAKSGGTDFRLSGPETFSDQQCQFSTHLRGCHTFPFWPHISTFPLNVALPQIWMLKLAMFALHDPAPSLATIYWTKLSPDPRETIYWLHRSQLECLQISELRQSWNVLPAPEWKSRSLLDLPWILPVALFFSISLCSTSYSRSLASICLILRGTVVIPSNKAW